MILKEYDGFYQRLIEHSKRFINENAKAAGNFQRALEFGKDPHFLNDYRYFAITKSTKTLIGIYELLKLGNYEDALTLSRTILECYISARYFDDKYDPDVVKDMVVIPTALADGLFVYSNGTVLRKDTNDTFEYTIRDPSSLCIGKDKPYFIKLYEYLCGFAHCNISQFDSFLNDSKECILYTERNAQPAHFVTLFAFSKLFESVVLLEVTRFSDENEEKACVDLLTELTEFLYDKMESFCESGAGKDTLSGTISKTTYRRMMNSLSEQLGRVDKGFVETIRKRYTETAIERELKPVLLESEAPSAFFEALRGKNKLVPRFDELKKLVGYVPSFLAEEDADAWAYTMRNLDRAAQYRERVQSPYAFMLSVLFCGFDITAREKTEPGKKDAERLLARITNNDKVKGYVLETVLHRDGDIVAHALQGE